jgi:hypothetical protein
LISFWRGIEYCHGESRYKITGKLKIKMPVTEVGGKDKLELSKSSNQSTKARKRQAEMTKIENPVNGIGEKDKLELSKSSNQSTETRGRQAGMTKMENPVTEVGEKDKNIRKVYPLRLLCSIMKEVFRDVMCMNNLSYLLYGGKCMFVGKRI